MICLNTRKALYTLFGGLIVMGANTMIHTQEQLTTYRSDNDKGMLNKIIHVLYAVGWLIVAYAIGSDNEGSLGMRPKTCLSFATIAGIIMSVIQMKKMKENDTEIPMHLPLIFAGSWLILGYTVGMGRPGINRLLGLFSSALIIVNMFVTLPWQREKGVVDGPGKELSALAWVALSLANSMI